MNINWHHFRISVLIVTIEVALIAWFIVIYGPPPQLAPYLDGAHSYEFMMTVSGVAFTFVAVRWVLHWEPDLQTLAFRPKTNGGETDGRPAHSRPDGIHCG